MRASENQTKNDDDTKNQNQDSLEFGERFALNSHGEVPSSFVMEASLTMIGVNRATVAF